MAEFDGSAHGANVKLQMDDEEYLIAFPFVGFNIGTLPENQVLLALGVFMTVTESAPSGEGTLQIRMTKEHAKILGDALVFAASATHIPNSRGRA